MTASIRQYLVITGNYWAFTLTDGALLVGFAELGAMAALLSLMLPHRHEASA